MNNTDNEDDRDDEADKDGDNNEKDIKNKKNNNYISDYFNIANNNIKKFKNIFNGGNSKSIENLSLHQKYFEDDENKFNKINLECKYMNSFVNDKDQFKNNRIIFKLDNRKKKLQEAILNKNKHLLNYPNIIIYF